MRPTDSMAWLLRNVGGISPLIPSAKDENKKLCNNYNQERQENELER